MTRLLKFGSRVILPQWLLGHRRRKRDDKPRTGRAPVAYIRMMTNPAIKIRKQKSHGDVPNEARTSAKFSARPETRSTRFSLNKHALPFLYSAKSLFVCRNTKRRLACYARRYILSLVTKTISETHRFVASYSRMCVC